MSPRFTGYRPALGTAIVESSQYKPGRTNDDLVLIDTKHETRQTKQKELRKMTTNRPETMRSTLLRKAALALSALALIGMGSMTVACSPRTEQPAETGVTIPSPTEKVVRTNVTRAPMSATPQSGGGYGGYGGNAAVPCGFGPSGGAPCGHW